VIVPPAPRPALPERVSAPSGGTRPARTRLDLIRVIAAPHPLEARLPRRTSTATVLARTFHALCGAGRESCPTATLALPPVAGRRAVLAARSRRRWQSTGAGRENGDCRAVGSIAPPGRTAGGADRPTRRLVVYADGKHGRQRHSRFKAAPPHHRGARRSAAGRRRRPPRRRCRADREPFPPQRRGPRRLT
jgi:hypothetical protein